MTALQRQLVQDVPEQTAAPLDVAQPDLNALSGGGAGLSPGGAVGMQGALGNAAIAGMISGSVPGVTAGNWLSDKVSAIGQWGSDLVDGVSSEGLDGLLDPVGAADRAAAQRDLADRFEIVGDDFEGERLSNQISQEEYERICAMYSDIRLGRGDLTIDASEYASEEDQAAYKAGAMNDIASLLQTEAGRGLVTLLHDNATQTDENGDPIHRHTTLGPLLNNDGSVDVTNGYAMPLGNGSGASYSRDGTMTPGTGCDVRIAYNPGVNVGDAYKEYQGANPWLAGFRSDVILMHEGNHAMQMTAGTVDNRTVQRTDNADNSRDPKMAQDARSGIRRVEHQAVGLGLYGNDPLTENAYRAERRAMAEAGAPGVQADDADLVPRTSYTPSASAAVSAPDSTGLSAPFMPHPHSEYDEH